MVGIEALGVADAVVDRPLERAEDDRADKLLFAYFLRECLEKRGQHGATALPDVSLGEDDWASAS